MDPQELLPLETTSPRPRPPVTRHCSQIAGRSCFRGPIRICRLIALLICLPSVFIIVPLYMRYRVFSGQMYPMSMSDMRLIDGRISTTWCQRQVVKSNTTFNAFVLPGPPELLDELVPVSMTRKLELEDDMKEYWGFYLLKGSTVTVSTCVSQAGASLIMIKGYKHLQGCAYIGDDSSEELDELEEALKEGLLSEDQYVVKKQHLKLKKIDGKANDPGAMKRHKAGVSFHDPSHVVNSSAPDNVPTVDITDHDPKELRSILDLIHARRQEAKNEHMKNYHPPSNLETVPELNHRYRETNVDRNERKFISFKDIDGKLSELVENELPSDRHSNHHMKTEPNHREARLHPKLQAGIGIKLEDTTESPDVDRNNDDKEGIVEDVEENDLKEYEKEEQSVNMEIKDEAEHIDGLKEVKTKYTTESPTQLPTEPNSVEVFEDVLKKLQALGDKGKKVLVKLHESMKVTYNETSPENSDIMSEVTDSEEELDRLRRILVEAIDEAKTKNQRQQRRREAREKARVKRELMLGRLELTKELNEDDEARDYAAEEGLNPDEFAEHHEKLNETTSIDMSNSEYWSSFSSSEEALLECEGLILNLPLTPHRICHAHATDEEVYSASRANALTYRVPSNGYYFFVFNSENEIHPNFIKARFDLQKTRYDVARSVLRECRNTTQRCDLALDIFSSQRVVLEVPLSNDDSLWNEEFMIMSECEPRTSLYLVCVIAVPILIMMFGLQ